ncbi:CGNR zinc finger domain-containing protein [Aeromicrobium alkaliterrae]|uniref:CGNR zinc finger domain-containing protein n=1 Tax=Aeromicrobium alkaliterrae TaxID=302168 RepID=A0ABP4WI74_9ACTN
MVFAHDVEMSLGSAAWLANSALEPDTLTTVDELDAFAEEHRFTGARAHDATELAEVRALRPRLREVMLASRDDAVELVNAMLQEGRALPRLVRHDQWDWHLHAVADDRPFAERILVETAMAMIDVIRADEMSRLSRCDDPECEGVVVDLSRNRSRRFCSTACGNRVAAAAYRARQRQD